MEMIYCNFNPNQNGGFILQYSTIPVIDKYIYYTRIIIFLFDRLTKMDRTRRRQIRARPFLRPAQFSIHHN